jgi:hypothetical protein
LWQPVSLNRFPEKEVLMSFTIEAFEAEALQLPEADRARLIERLIASLDADPDVEEAFI